MALRIIGGRLRGRVLRLPAGRVVRPTSDRVREALFNILGQGVEGRVAYDLFAGSGALGIEALSRGARQAVFVERHRRATDLIRRNLREFGLGGQAVVVVADVFRWVDRWSDWPEDPALVLLDPPYEEYQRRPGRMVELLHSLQEKLPPATILALEHDRQFDVTQVPGTWEVRRYGQTQIALSTLDSLPS